jgi:hypothetical protein
LSWVMARPAQIAAGVAPGELRESGSESAKEFLLESPVFSESNWLVTSADARS